MSGSVKFVKCVTRCQAVLTVEVLGSKLSCLSISLWLSQRQETTNRPLFAGSVQLCVSESTAFRVLGALCILGLDFGA